MVGTGAAQRVVIVGGGFGGLRLAKVLADDPVEVTLVDRRNHHTFQPLLYQVATAMLDPAAIARSLRAIFRRQANVEVRLATSPASTGTPSRWWPKAIPSRSTSSSWPPAR